MKKHSIKFVFTLALLVGYIPCFSQNHDSIRFSGPRLMITHPKTGKQTPLKLSRFEIKVEVVDNIAVTTMDMTFYNEQTRQLEGELVFPLAEGQTVSRFAMDRKGVLREGVVVEKQKGQKVFESIVRRRIDPALLEWTSGNNFKARIFPIPAKGSKRIVIAYEQELKLEDSGYVYKVPLEFDMPITTFLLNIQVFNIKNYPIVKSQDWKDLKFTKTFTAFTAQQTKSDYTATGDFEIMIPNTIKNNFVFSQGGKVDNKSFFYINIFKQKQTSPKILPKKLCIYWDASASETARDTSNEIALLTSYLTKCKDVNVKLVLFSNAMDTIMNFDIIEGNCSHIIKTIKNINYDGGTQLGALDFNAIPCDEILLFSDGVSNFGKSEIVLSSIPVITINSSATAEHAYLNYIANKTAGEYLNLTKLKTAEAIEILSNNNLSFISAEYNKNEIEDMYPSTPVICRGNIPFAGVLKKPEAKIKINFGFGNTITSSEEIILQQDTLPTNGIIERIWAQKRIKELQTDYKNHDEEITQTGKKYGIVTRNTSLIVLDTITDYVLYEILPPADMQEQYYALLKQKKVVTEENFSTKINRLLFNYQQKTDWYNGKLPSNEIISTPIIHSNLINNTVTTDSSRSANNHTQTNINPPTNNTSTSQITIRNSQANLVGGITISGRIIDAESGEPIPFANIIDEANSNGTVSDFDGQFSLIVAPNAQIKITFIGYKMATFTATESANLDIALQQANVEMSTVEIVDYSIPLLSRDATTSSSVIRSEINTNSGRSVNDLISSIGGLNVSDDGDEINVRGARNDGNALYIDGIRVTENFRIPKSAIEEIQVYTGGVPAQYGDFTGGVIDITTKGYRNNRNNNTYSDSWSNRSSNTYNEDKTVYPKPEPAPWADKLNGIADKNIYKLYCELKPEYIGSSAFYSDFSDACFQTGQQKNGLKILSNLAEIDLQNHELSKILARKLQQDNEKELAILKYQDILKVRPEEPQSYRDLGLAYYENGQYQQSVDMLYNVLTKDWDGRFPGIESVVIGELSAIINLVGDKIDLSKIDKRLIKNLPVDLRVVINWDADNTDMDLWVTAPSGEKCFYGNRNSKFGGYLSQDYTRGYGPEEFMLKDAKKGNYKIQVNYYGSGRQDTKKIVTIHVQVFTNYGTSMQQKRDYVFSLNNNRQLIDVETFSYSK